MRFAATLLGATVVLTAGRAHASGFDAPTIGSAQSGPVTNDAAAVWWNPGRLGYLRDTELHVGAGLIIGAASFQRDYRSPYQYTDNLDFAEPVAPSDIDPRKAGKQSKSRAIPVGPALDAFVAIPAIRDRLVVGLGVSIPYVAVLNFPETGAHRFAGQSIFLATPHATLALAVKLHRVISIGAGVSYVLGNMSLSKIQDFGALGTFGDSLERPPISQENDFGPDAPS
ncbi:MAG: outer membrane protein transport protein, partial [Deltaproteobacteria bacterium]|nr:outer membrane protein transport protein [Nannocystaceae bacterium]